MIELPVVQPSHAPVQTLMLYLTEDCNLRCTYCFVKKTPRAMSSETARKTVDYYLHRNISGKVRHLALTFFGGEPFMALDVMEEIIAYCREQRKRTQKIVHFSATTNATIATPRVERIVRDSNMSLLVSMDGGEDAMESRPYVHGGSPYKAVARNLKRLVKWSPTLVVRMTYHPEVLDLKKNIQRALDLGAPSIALCPVTESNWNGYEERLEEVYQEIADWFISEARQGRFLPLEITWQQLRKTHNAKLGGSRPERPCSVGQSLIAVAPDGHVMPCHMYIYRKQDWFGTVDDPHFPPEREQYVQLSTRTLLGCETCLAEPICGGGCRAVAVGELYDFHTGKHPGYCLNTRAQARCAYRIYQTLMDEMPETFTHALRHYKPASQYFGELVS